MYISRSVLMSDNGFPILDPDNPVTFRKFAFEKTRLSNASYTQKRYFVLFRRLDNSRNRFLVPSEIGFITKRLGAN
jgi:hypothetical protein